MTTSKVIDAWAVGERRSGRSGNVSFEGRDLYSYSMHIGRLFEYNNRRIALLTTNNRSQTTAGHIAKAYSAASRRGYATLQVPCLVPITETNRKHFKEVRDRILNQLKGRVINSNVIMDLGQLESLRDSVRIYCEAFGISPIFPGFDEIGVMLVDHLTPTQLAKVMTARIAA